MSMTLCQRGIREAMLVSVEGFHSDTLTYESV